MRRKRKRRWRWMIEYFRVLGVCAKIDDSFPHRKWTNNARMMKGGGGGGGGS